MTIDSDDDKAILEALSEVLSKRGGDTRKMLLRIVRELNKEACFLCSPQCPLSSENIFEDLCGAIEDQDNKRVERLLDQMTEFGQVLARTQQITRDVRVIVSAFPKVWGADKPYMFNANKNGDEGGDERS